MTSQRTLHRQNASHTYNYHRCVLRFHHPVLHRNWEQDNQNRQGLRMFWLPIPSHLWKNLSNWKNQNEASTSQLRQWPESRLSLEQCITRWLMTTILFRSTISSTWSRSVVPGILSHRNWDTGSQCGFAIKNWGNSISRQLVVACCCLAGFQLQARWMVCQPVHTTTPRAPFQLFSLSHQNISSNLSSHLPPDRPRGFPRIQTITIRIRLIHVSFTVLTHLWSAHWVL
jgi:hypothetical protein